MRNCCNTQSDPVQGVLLDDPEEDEKAWVSTRVVQFIAEGSIGSPSVTKEFESSPDSGQAITNFSPAGSILRKSEGLAVARVASERRAAAAIMQSTRLPRRRPERLNSVADKTASSVWNGIGSPRKCDANSASGSLTGPQRNSAQPMALMPSDSPCSSHRLSALPCGESWSNPRIRKLVSR